MKAVVCQNSELEVREIAEPALASGQVRLKVLRCGICGSDLHMRHHCGPFGALMRRSGYQHFPGPQDPIVFGHEISAEVLEHGPGTTGKLKPGTRVCAMPILRIGAEIDMVGLSARAHGAYAERMVAEESMLVPIPNGLASDVAALTEPMAVALHAVNRGEVAKDGVAVVIGCGPVGLGVIAMLKARGVKTVIAADFSPGRRRFAELCGADKVVDPAKESPYANWGEMGFLPGLPELLELAVSTKEKLGKLPVPWWHAWRLAEGLGLKPKAPVIFECVGVPGVLQSVIDGAPLMARVIGVGVCMQPDTIEPALAINKEIEVRFVLGYSPLEYRDALHLMAEGKVQCAHLITATVGLDGVAGAFEALRDPERHAKILVDPSQAA